MKKLLSVTLALLCLCSVVPAALAAGQTYELPALNMTIDAPNGWYVLTQDVKEGDPALKALGLAGNADTYVNYLKKSGIYLDMISKDTNTHIFVGMQETSSSQIINDFSSLDDKDVLGAASQLQGVEKYVNGQFTITDSSVYRHKQAKFAVTEFTVKNSGVTMYGSIYFTVKNGQTILVFMASKVKISGSVEKTLKITVDSIVFKKFRPETVFPAEPATYELPELNMKIDSPGGWYASTCDVKDDDPNLEIMDMDKEGLAGFYKENDIYFFLISSDLNAAIYVNMKDSSDDPEYIDFNYCSDEDLLQMAPEMQGEETLLDSSVYMHSQTKFIVLYFDNSIRYQTQINGQAVFITMTLHEGKITDSLEQTLKSVADSIVFTKATSKPGALEPATYELPDLNMTIDSPEGWIVFTRDIFEDNPDLVFLGVDGEELADQYEKGNIYMDMISKDLDTHILVRMSESDGSRDIYDYNDLNDEDLLAAASGMQGEKKLTFSNMSVYTHKQAKFAVADFTAQINGETGYGKMYLTVINGQEISVGLQSTSEIPDSLAQTLQDTVDSIDFAKVTAKPVPAAPDAAAYELPELNMIVDSPKGWFVFTRDVKEDDPNLKALGIDGKGLADQYKEDGIYLDMISAEPYSEIAVVMTGSGGIKDMYDDFNDIDNDELQTVAHMEAARMGGWTDFSNFSVYMHKQTKFAVCDYAQEEDGKTVYVRVYFTVINRQAIYIMLLSPKAEISGSYAQVLQDTIDNITFTKVPTKLTDYYIILCASLAGAAAGAVIGSIIITIRKRRTAG